MRLMPGHRHMTPSASKREERGTRQGLGLDRTSRLASSEATGLGVPRKSVAGMRAHNGTEPELVEEESRFIVRLWKHPYAAAADKPLAGETLWP